MKTSVLVIGLGRFGTAAARELMLLGHEVLAVDANESIVNEIAPDVTHAVQLDAADEEALRAIGAAEFEHAIVAISERCRGEHLRDDGAQEAGRAQRGRQGRQRRCTARSWSGWAPTGSSSRSGRWGSASPTRSRSGRSSTTSTWRRASAS